MFTGIVSEMGQVRSFRRDAGGARVEVACPMADGLARGESISVAGACLTVEGIEGGAFAATLSPETLECTTLGNLKAEARVNLERSLTPTQLLGGHFVLGHVDAVGSVRSVRTSGVSRVVDFLAPAAVHRYLVAKGSVTVDGVSLTVNGVGDGSFSVALIPETLEVTTLGGLQGGARVNLEADILGKYVERLLHPAGPGGRPGSLLRTAAS